ncbi:hypothetical protein WJX77_003102 [Trebouxia sp. C0004]
MGKGVSDQQRSAKTQQAKGLKMSPSSITRLPRRKGLQHLTAKMVPMLTASQKLARVRHSQTGQQKHQSQNQAPSQGSGSR